MSLEEKDGIKFEPDITGDREKRRGHCVNGGRDWGDIPVIQGRLVAARSWKRAKKRFRPRIRGNSPADSLILDFGLQNIERINFYYLSYQVCNNFLWQTQETNAMSGIYMQNCGLLYLLLCNCLV